MKTRKTITTAVVTALTTGFVAFGAYATEKAVSEPSSVSALSYESQASGPGIHSYVSATPSVVSRKPQLIYVSLAYGPAIHSYAHPGEELVADFNVEYVSPAFGPAIYSYPGNWASGGSVKILPLMVE